MYLGFIPWRKTQEGGKTIIRKKVNNHIFLFSEYLEKRHDVCYTIYIVSVGILVKDLYVFWWRSLFDLRASL